MFARILRFAPLLVLPILAVGCAHGPQAPNFTLTDDHASAWSLAQQHEPVLLTFGYTHCTDTCPLTLAKLAKVANEPRARAAGLRVAFITVDPRRDTPAVLHRYLQRFGSSSLIGLTGTPAQLAAVERAYHVWAQALPAKHGTYSEAHGTTIVYINNGAIRSYQDDSDSLASLTAAMNAMLG